MPTGNLIIVAEIPLEQDCASFSVWLRAQGIPHQFVEQRGKLVLYVEESLAVRVQQALTTYLSNESVRGQVNDFAVQQKRPGAVIKWHLWGRPARAPIVTVSALLCVLVALATNLGEGGPVLRALVFADPFQVANDNFQDRLSAISFLLSNGQWWRFLSPALLHFNVMHLVFNLLWLWYFGAKIELRKGSLYTLLLVSGLAVSSNTVQFLLTGPLFGGMSGVVYGLLGYCWLIDARSGRQTYQVPDALFWFMLFWLALGFVEITEYLGMGKMANGAHLVGLLAGLLVALIASLKPERITPARSEHEK